MRFGNERVVAEIDEVVAIGEMLARDAAHSDSGLGPERVEELMSIASRGGQLIQRLYPRGNQYQANLDRVLGISSFATMHSSYHAHIAQLVGIFKGVQNDIRTGMLADLRGLLQAQIFADFLEMAEHLLEQGYKDPAAVLLGAVLEDALRKVAESRSLSTMGANGRPLTIDPINTALAKSGAYSPLIQKQITSWANLRNSAAHGRFDEYDKDQVHQMLFFVQKFSSDHLG